MGWPYILYSLLKTKGWKEKNFGFVHEHLKQSGSSLTTGDNEKYFLNQFSQLVKCL